MWPPPCSCATEMKRMPAAGKRSSASMYAEPTMPKTFLTPCATSVSTNASDGVIVWRPWTARFLDSVIVFIVCVSVESNLLFCGSLRAARRATFAANVRPVADVVESGNERRGIRPRVTLRLGDRRARHLAERDVQSLQQVRIVGERALPSLVGD